MKKNLLILFALCVCAMPLRAQDDGSSYRTWTNQHTLIMCKWSQLFYELNIGITGSTRRSANFCYFSAGYGKPNTENAWRKFLPASQQAAPTSKDEMLAKQDDNTKGLHAGTIGVGWQHFFTHWIGFHVQAGWSFIADLGGGNSSSSVTTSSSTSSDDSSSDDKSTFIYNSAPIQAGLEFCLWRHLELQGGVTYMWKEIPILTVGVGVVF